MQSMFVYIVFLRLHFFASRFACVLVDDEQLQRKNIISHFPTLYQHYYNLTGYNVVAGEEDTEKGREDKEV